MKLFRPNKAFLPFLMFASMAFFAQAAVANTWTTTATNTGAAINDVHFLIAGTGGGITNVKSNPAGAVTPCPSPCNTIDITFNASVPNGGNVQVQFDLPNGLTPSTVTANWTLNGVNVGNITPLPTWNNVNPPLAVAQAQAPLPTWTLIVLAGAMLIILFAAQRKRAA